MAAAAGYQHLSSTIASNTHKDDNDDLISKVIAKEMEEIVEPYINRIFHSFGSAEADLDNLKSRGVPGHPIPSLSDNIVNAVAHW